MYIKDYIIRGLKHCYRLFSRKEFLNPECECNRELANEMIYNLLKKGKPCMISRFGTTEINCINNYLCINRNRNFWLKCWDYISDKTHTPWWNKDHFHIMSIYSGIFPEGQDTAERFSKRYLCDIPEIDMLACHQYYERFMPLKNEVLRVQLEMLYPFFVEKPWTRILTDKKVLVIHPFEETIKQQYNIRHELFENKDILPNFELITLKAVQTIAGTASDFTSWFDALKYMEKQISEINFDIAIIGCGAYGLPLAAYIKKMGKQAVHIGGGTQLLFGILGKRWVNQYDEWLNNIWKYRPGIDISVDYRPLFNDNWCYPLVVDTPKFADKVENACYWK